MARTDPTNICKILPKEHGRRGRAPFTLRRDAPAGPTLAESRAYAEAWYQALRVWRVEEVPVETGFHYSPGSGIDFPTLGTGSSVARQLVTPAGPMREGDIGSAITQMAVHGTVEVKQLGRMLERVRRGTSLASLVREGGTWAREREVAMRYATAVLTLAIRLRDEQAEMHLANLRK